MIYVCICINIEQSPEANPFGEKVGNKLVSLLKSNVPHINKMAASLFIPMSLSFLRGRTMVSLKFYIY